MYRVFVAAHWTGVLSALAPLVHADKMEDVPARQALGVLSLDVLQANGTRWRRGVTFRRRQAGAVGLVHRPRLALAFNRAVSDVATSSTPKLGIWRRARCADRRHGTEMEYADDGEEK